MPVRSHHHLFVFPSAAFQELPGLLEQPNWDTDAPFIMEVTRIPSSGRSAVGLVVGLTDGDVLGDFVGEICDILGHVRESKNNTR